jgi:hypothetical protein
MMHESRMPAKNKTHGSFGQSFMTLMLRLFPCQILTREFEGSPQRHEHCFAGCDGLLRITVRLHTLSDRFARPLAVRLRGCGAEPVREGLQPLSAAPPHDRAEQLISEFASASVLLRRDLLEQVGEHRVPWPPLRLDGRAASGGLGRFGLAGSTARCAHRPRAAVIDPGPHWPVLGASEPTSAGMQRSSSLGQPSACRPAIIVVSKRALISGEANRSAI